MELFPFSYRLSDEVSHLIWISDDGDSKKDRFVTDENGLILSFQTMNALDRYAASQGIELTPSESSPLDLDRIIAWLTSSNEYPDCQESLNAWNAFSDVANTRKHHSTFSKLNFNNKTIYGKLFWGNNLPAVTPHGETYKPVWTPAEIEAMRNIMQSGLDLFVSSLHRYTELS